MALSLLVGLVVLVLVALGVGGELLRQRWYRRTHTLEQWEHLRERLRQHQSATYRQVKADLHERYNRARRDEY